MWLKCLYEVVEVCTNLSKLIKRKDYYAVNSDSLQVIGLLLYFLSFLIAHKKASKMDTLLNDHLSPGKSADRDSWTEGNCSASSSNRFPVRDLSNEFERVALDWSSGAEDMADSGLGCITASSSEGLESSLGTWDLTKREEDDFSSEEYYTADEDTDTECQTTSRGGSPTPARRILNHTSPWSCEEEDLSSSVSSCSSYRSTHSTPEHPEESQPQVFLTG